MNHHHHHSQENHSAHTVATTAAAFTTTAASGTENTEHVHASSMHDHHDSHQMVMFFHGGCSEVVLFDWWRVDSIVGLLFSCILIFFMAAAYEGIKWLRVYYQMYYSTYTEKSQGVISLADVAGERGVEDVLLQKASAQPQLPEAVTNRNVGTLSNEQVYVPTVVAPPIGPRKSLSKFRTMRRYVQNYAVKSPTNLRFVEALLYGLQLIVAYFLMLIAMTYNVYLFTAVVVGAAFGHWIFTGLKCVLVQSITPSTTTSNALPLTTNANCIDNFASDACH